MTDTSETLVAAEEEFFRRYRKGFEKIRHRLQTRKGGLLIEPQEELRILVRFVDPSQSTSGVVTPDREGESIEREDIYEKIISTFHDEHDLRLKQVSYQQLRTGNKGTTDAIRIAPQKADPHSIEQIDQDPANWHQLPFCYVYFATCSNYESYRTKVKPAVQAFMRQIESMFKVEKTDSDATETPRPTFVVAYVPSTDSSPSEETAASSASRMGAALASRMAMARQRISGREASGDGNAPSGAASSAASEASGELETEESVSVEKFLSGKEKDILRRFRADFSGVHIAAIPLSGDPSNKQEEQKYELSAFLKALGDAVADNFKERCRLLDETIRKLDAKRAAGSTQRSKLAHEESSILTDFFLVKEGLAITYQQMRLMSEALLQYNELKAIIPDLKSDAATIVRGLKSRDAGRDATLLEAAMLGKVETFRELLKAETAFEQIPEMLETYLLVREVSLLFAIGNPVEVMKKSISYVTAVHWYKLEKARRTKDENQRREALLQAEVWGFNFCWDLKDATSYYYGEDSLVEKTAKDPKPKGSRVVNITFARLICDILELARLRFLKIGTYRLEGDALVASLSKPHFSDMSQQWQPYTAIQESNTEATSEAIAVDPDKIPSKGNDFLFDAFTDSASFQSRYLQILDIAASYNRHGERNRSAGRLSTDLVEIYVREGDRSRAAQALEAVASDYGSDQWRACQFLLLFRLAGLQRQVKASSEYLDILVSSFGSHFDGLAPKAAQKLLFDDLVQIMNSGTKDKQFTGASLFTTTLPLDPIKAYTPVRGERGLVKRLVSVGQEVQVKFDLDNHLPETISIDCIELSLVPFPSYVAAHEDGIPILKKDVTKTLKLTGDLKCEPGLNHFYLTWMPLSPGQFVVAFATIRWKGVEFSYTTKEIRPHLIRMDVLPSETTQTLKIEPAFLLPGQVQPVKLLFAAGSDIVQEALLTVAGSPGVRVALTPDNEQWNSSCDIEIAGQNPGDVYEMTLYVKTSRKNTQAFHAQVSSTFRFPTNENLDEIKEDVFMDTILKASIPSMSDSAVVIEGSSFLMYAPGKGILNLSLSSQIPAVLKLLKSSLKLPPFIQLSDKSSVDCEMSELRLAQDERVLLAFDCDVVDVPPKTLTQAQGTLEIDFEDDHKTAFHEELEFDLLFNETLAPQQEKGHLNFSVTSTQKDEIPVGIPTTLVYKCSDAGALGPKSFIYQVQVVSECWMVAGRSRGEVEVVGSDLTIEVTGTPIRAGTIRSFPPLSLLALVDGKPRACSVSLAEPSSLQAKPPESQVTVASSDSFFEL